MSNAATVAWDEVTAERYVSNGAHALHHLRAESDLRVGRIVRREGEALCRKSIELCGMVNQPAPAIFDRCPVCATIAEKHDLEVLGVLPDLIAPTRRQWR